jgi:hypothetical protein
MIHDAVTQRIIGGALDANVQLEVLDVGKQLAADKANRRVGHGAEARNRGSVWGGSAIVCSGAARIQQGHKKKANRSVHSAAEITSVRLSSLA